MIIFILIYNSVNLNKKKPFTYIKLYLLRFFISCPYKELWIVNGFFIMIYPYSLSLRASKISFSSSSASSGLSCMQTLAASLPCPSFVSL